MVGKVHKHLSFHLSGAQLGITLTTLATGYLAEPVLSRFLTPLIDVAGVLPSTAQSIALILAMVVAALLSMVYGELVPKNVAITNPMRAAKFTIRPVIYFNRIFSPFIRGLNWSANRLVTKLGIDPADELASARSPQELGALVRNSALHGGMSKNQAILIDRSLKFGDVSADEIMTPRAKVETLDKDASMTDLLMLAMDTGHSRFPITDGDLDNTLGVIHVKTAFTVPTARRDSTFVIDLAEPAPVVPASLDCDSVLKIVRQSGCEMAMVADEYGGTSGIVTIEDMVEEILGAVFDEHDDTENETEIRQSGTSWDCSGLVRIDELEARLGYKAPDGPYETLGGVVMTNLKRIPVEGDIVVLPDLDTNVVENNPLSWSARVISMDGRRVDRVLLTPIGPETASTMATTENNRWSPRGDEQ